MTIEPRPIDLEATLRAHPFVRVERPPELWQPDALDVPFVGLLGEMLAAALGRNGITLAEVTLNVSNISVDEASAGPMPAGEFVAVTVSSAGNWGPELQRVPAVDQRPPIVSHYVEHAAVTAGVRWAYTRDLGDGRGSVTVFFNRRLSQ